MRKFSRIFAIIFAMIMAIAFIACSNVSSSGDGSNAGVGTSSDDNEGKIITEFNSNYTIFSGNNDFGNWNLPWLECECIGFSEGDQIQITHTKSETFSDYKMLETYARTRNYPLIEGRVINGKRHAEEKKHIIPTTYNQTTTYTLSASEAERINADGRFGISGCGVNVSKVSLNVKGSLSCLVLKNGWIFYGCDKYDDHFTLSFAPKSTEDEKKFSFYYTYDATTQKIKVSKVKLGNDTIFEGNNFTATYSADSGGFDRHGIKFESLPEELSNNYFLENAYYPAPSFESLFGGGSTSITGSTYRGEMTRTSETVYIDFIFRDGTTWNSLGYKDNTFSTTTPVGTTTGTYSISGTTITINMPVFDATLTGTTSDDWATIVCSGNQLFTGTLTKQ